MSAEQFNPEDFEDEYRKRFLAKLEEKAKGGEIKPAAPPKQQARVID
jgi:non-homologous end joining protein Ku